MPFLSDTVVCFDLDDTLYKEIDYLKSAYREVASVAGHPEVAPQMLDWYYVKENTFQKLIETYGLSITIEECLKIYRNHLPVISLDAEVKEYLEKLKEAGAKLGLISDGRSITQKNKLKALGLEGFFDKIVISEELGSEKPNTRNYQVVMDEFPERKRFLYVGDNPLKDFIAPNKLGWRTYCLKNDGRNIHGQYMSLPKEYMPNYVINKLEEIIKF